ncbi:mucin-binding protein, partial [Lactobacillus helveticus]
SMRKIYLHKRFDSFVNYVDADNTKVGSQEFTNKPETKNVVENIQAPKGWTFVGADGKPAGNIGTVTINFGVKDSSQNIPVTHNIVKSYEYKDVTETINITAPEGGDFVDNQTKEHKSSEIIPVKLQVARLVTTDEFTGEVTPAGDWKANTVDDSTKQLLTEFPERSLPTFKGYTPQTDKGTITDGKLSSFPLIKNGQPVQDFTVKITYKSNNPDYGK